jgi:hypothetical protein
VFLVLQQSSELTLISLLSYKYNFGFVHSSSSSLYCAYIYIYICVCVCVCVCVRVCMCVFIYIYIYIYIYTSTTCFGLSGLIGLLRELLLCFLYCNCRDMLVVCCSQARVQFICNKL